MLVGGSTAINLDTRDVTGSDRAKVIPAILLVIFVVLALLLRALVAPVLLIIANVLSFGATLGISALVFEYVFDFPASDPSTSLIGFVFLVALGIDYSIFLMTRVREESIRQGTHPGILKGLSATGGVITSAGIVLAATFAALGVIPILFLAQIGFIVAFGVLLDALVVRSLLVPALSYDIGRCHLVALEAVARDRPRRRRDAADAAGRRIVHGPSAGDVPVSTATCPWTIAEDSNKKSGLTVCLLRRDDGRVPTTTRVPQADRTRAMRLRLLEATIELLVERGFSGTSTTLVSERAGVSRGAQLHHFPTKNDLVVAAVEHLTELRGLELEQAVGRLPHGAGRTRAVVRMLGDHFSSPVFAAALELWVAARTDEQLLAAVAPLEQRVGRETHRLTVEALGVDESRPGTRELVQGTLDLVRGLGLADTITDDTRRRRRILDHWADGPRPGAGGGPMNDVLDRVLADLGTEGDRLDDLVSGLPDDALRTPTPAAGWDVATQVAHLAWTDEAALLAATDRAGWDALVTEAARRPGRVRRPRPRSRADASHRPTCSPAGAPRGRRWPTRCATYPDGDADAVVRPADVGDVDGDGTVHGDLGPLPRRPRGAGRRARRSPTGSATSPTSASAPATSRSPSTASSRRPTEFRVELTAPSGDLWAWGDEDAGQSVRGSALDFCRLVTQRVHRGDTDLVAQGRDANAWLEIAQCFAGPPGEGRRAPMTEPLRIGNCSGFYGDRLSAMREMLEGGPARRADRRLPRRAHDADPRQGRDEGRLAGLRPDLRTPGRGLPRPRAGARHPDRRQRRRAQPGRAGRPAARGRPRARPGPGGRPRRGRRPARPSRSRAR